MSRKDPNEAPPPSLGAERRRRRSDDPITALHYQLSVARSEGKLEALVLVDDRGCLVAGAGAWPVCEELAAYAPLLAEPDLPKNAVVGTRIADLSREVVVSSLPLGAAEALLAVRGGGDDRSAFVARAAAGVQRILRAA
ncbi:hypothetical protein [Polyangium spumosum]|uniref:Roadblock/LC7 domain-containing protein n=1 Tax=Polyangium spumosum TaxID=889282 RepID=A0A6N7PMV9_9BACT|nr:hypothetical protein [Polyangium spumosum]MRG93492.1 hypothetical protein [Polyangium spumosum]